MIREEVERFTMDGAPIVPLQFYGPPDSYDPPEGGYGPIEVTCTGRAGDRIRALGENRQGDITYVVTVTPARHDARLRWNMTTSVTIAP